MKRKEAEEDIPRVCAFCEKSERLFGDVGRMICKKRGVVDEKGCCRLFKYDLMKREPQKPEKPALMPVDE